MADTDVYKPSIDGKGNWYPDGPGNHFGYYGYILFPASRVDSEKEARKLCLLLNDAYQAGVRSQIHKVKEALGLNEK